MKFDLSPALDTRPTRLLTRSVVSFMLLAALGCGSAGGGQGGKSAKGKGCFAPEEVRVTLPERAPMKLPNSRIWVHVQVPGEKLSAAISREIPVTLASEKNRDVGAPGYATYRVTRKAPHIETTKNGLAVSVPIRADISVCKKIGSACIRYGSCQPEFLARFTVSTEIAPNYDLETPKGSITATKRCVIGLDVTPQIERIAQQELRSVQARIARQWPRLRPDAKRAWEQMHATIPLGESACVRAAPEQVRYVQPRFSGDSASPTLSAAVGVIGKIAAHDDCSKGGEIGDLPKAKVKKKAPKKTRLFVPEVLGIERAKDELAASLEGPWGEGGQLETLAAEISGNRVALHVKSSGPVCGSLWVRGKLSHEAGAEALHLEKLEIAGSASDPAASALLEHVALKARISLQSSAWFSDATLAALKLGLAAAIPDDVEFSVNGLEAGSARINAAEDGLYVLHPLSAQLVITGF